MPQKQIQNNQCDRKTVLGHRLPTAALNYVIYRLLGSHTFIQMITTHFYIVPSAISWYLDIQLHYAM